MRNDGDVRAAIAFMSNIDYGPAVFDRVYGAVSSSPDVLVRTTKSQVAFWRRRPFAFLWLPAQYQREPRTAVVMSIALPGRVDSPRFSQVVQASKTTWMHHLDVAGVADLDDDVLDWLRRAANFAG